MASRKKRKKRRAPGPSAVTHAPASPPRQEQHWRARLERLKVEVAKARVGAVRKLQAARARSPHMLGLVVIAVVQVFAIVTAPFVVLVRGAVWLYQGQGVPGWAALLLSGWATLLLLSIYGAALSRRFTGRARLKEVAKWVAAPLVVGYCVFSLLYLARGNAKDDAVRAVYTSTHPLLRVALSTMMLFDRNAVITDISRTPDDYKRMGLAVNQRSLHYRQPDGWIHAVDLRTRSPVRSVVVEWYFLLMGFDTLRHAGTSDHLHVSLALRQ